MATKILIKHTESGMVTTGFYGFSWTYLFFGWFVPLFRGELGVGVLHLLFSIVTFGLWQLIVCFLYNKQYMTRMITNGWVLSGSDFENSAAGTILGISTQNWKEHTDEIITYGNEELIKSSGGGPITFITGGKGGNLYLTTHRIYHKSLIGRKITFSYNLDEVVDVQKSRYSMLLMIIPLFTCIKIFFKTGTHVKLQVSDKQGWIVAIKEAKHNFKSVMSKIEIDSSSSESPKIVNSASGQEQELKKIDDMFEKSLITEDEMAQMRNNVLGLG